MQFSSTKRWGWVIVFRLAAGGCTTGDGTPKPTDSASSQSSAAPCVAESDAVFCARHGTRCGTLSALDNCGTSRAVASCGECVAPESCGGGGVTSLCGCTAENDLELCQRRGYDCGIVTEVDSCGATRSIDCGNCRGCAPEEDAELCARLGRECGPVTAADNCGASRSVADCGACSSPLVCNATGACETAPTAGSDTTPPAGATPGGGTTPPDPGSSGGTPPAGGGTVGSKAAALAEKLRGKRDFLFGLGNDAGIAVTLGLPLDLHYQYIVGDWPTWNTDAAGQGAFVTRFAGEAHAHGMTPMFTLYQMADRGDGAISAMADDSFMASYWQRVRLLFDRLRAFDKPALVQIEPDFWGYAFQKGMRDGTAVAKLKAYVPECAGLTDTLAGMGRCFMKMRDALAPKVLVGLHVTNWGFQTAAMLTFYRTVGAELGDFITVETLDRDAGCFEARIEADCQRGGSGWYWDETNRTSPNFHDHLGWVGQMTAGLGVPVIWWQTPLGVPSSTFGTTGRYRDNRVHYFFSHVDELIAAGGVGAVFGSGTTPPTEQTTLATDGGQFKNAAAAYYASPVALP